MASAHYIPIHGCLSLLHGLLILHSRRGYSSHWMRGNRYLSVHGWIQPWHGPSALHILCRIIRKFRLKPPAALLKYILTELSTATRSTRHRYGIRDSHMLGIQLHPRIDMASFT